jgi:predicted MFS family arabinose efflux permease
MAYQNTRCDLSVRENVPLQAKEDVYDSQPTVERHPVNVAIAELVQDGHTDSRNDDTNAVFWDSPQDPTNPYNWPQWRKTVNCTIISALSFVAPLGVSMLAPTIPEVMKSFRSSDDVVAAFVVSVYILGFATGPLLMAPLSEIYGRLPIYHTCNTLFVASLIACALAPSLEALIALRFVSGAFGSCILTNGGGSIADMIPQEKRGTFMAAFSMGPLVGPAIGPIIGTSDNFNDGFSALAGDGNFNSNGLCRWIPGQ